MPSKVIAKDTEESPLIKVRTAKGGRRPILEKQVFLRSEDLQSLLNLLVSDDQSDNEREELDGIHQDVIHRRMR